MATNPLLLQTAGGQSRIEPSVFSQVTVDTRIQQRLQAFRDVIFLSPFEGGPAGEIGVYIDPQSIREVFDPEGLHGSGVTLSDYMKAPTYDPRVPGAYRMYIGRVGKPTSAMLTLKDDATPTPADVLTLESKDKGTYTNKISVEIAPGTIVGLKFIQRFGISEVVTLDNLRNALDVSYYGNATAATMTITRTGDAATRLQTTLTGQTDGSINLDLDLTFEEWSSVSELSLYINAQNGYRASINPYAAPLLPTSELDQVVDADLRTVAALAIQYTGTGTACTLTVTDTKLTTTVTGGLPTDALDLDLTVAGTDTLGELVAAIEATGVYTCDVAPHANVNALVAHALAPVTAQDIDLAAYTVDAKPGLYSYVATAELGALVYAINSRSTRVTAARVQGAETPPAYLSQTYMPGGTNPPPTINDWLDMLDKVSAEDLIGGMVFINTNSPTMQATVMAWIVDQKNIKGATFRAFFGAPPGLPESTYRSMAAGLNSSAATMACQRILFQDGITQLDPIYAGAIMCGLAAGVPPGQTTTNVAVRARGLIDKYPLAIREQMMSSGLSILKEVKGRGIVTAFSLTTSLSTIRMYRVLSESMAIDYIDTNIRLVLLDFLGAWGTKSLIPQVKGRVGDTLALLEGQGIITKGIDQHGQILPAYLPPSVGLQAGLLKVVWQCWIGGEISQISSIGTVAYQTFEIELPTGAVG